MASAWRQIRDGMIHQNHKETFSVSGSFVSSAGGLFAAGWTYDLWIAPDIPSKNQRVLISIKCDAVARRTMA